MIRVLIGKQRILFGEVWDGVDHRTNTKTRGSKYKNALRTPKHNWRASVASETLTRVTQFENRGCLFVYICDRLYMWPSIGKPGTTRHPSKKFFLHLRSCRRPDIELSKFYRHSLSRSRYNRPNRSLPSASIDLFSILRTPLCARFSRRRSHMDVRMSFCTLTLRFAPRSTRSQTSLNRILWFIDQYPYHTRNWIVYRFEFFCGCSSNLKT